MSNQIPLEHMQAINESIQYIARLNAKKAHIFFQLLPPTEDAYYVNVLIDPRLPLIFKHITFKMGFRKEWCDETMRRGGLETMSLIQTAIREYDKERTDTPELFAAACEHIAAIEKAIGEFAGIRTHRLEWSQEKEVYYTRCDLYAKFDVLDNGQLIPRKPEFSTPSLNDDTGVAFQFRTMRHAFLIEGAWLVSETPHEEALSQIAVIKTRIEREIALFNKWRGM